MAERKEPAWRTERIRTADVVLDPEVLPRIATDDDEHYKTIEDLLRRRTITRPVVVRVDGRYVLVDGSYRHRAHAKLGIDEIECDVSDGGEEDAVWYASGANSRHGKPLSNAQKRKAVDSLLGVPRYEKLTDIQLADHVGCSLGTVASARKDRAKRIDKINRDLASGGRRLPEEPGKEVTQYVKDGRFVGRGTEGAIEVTVPVKGRGGAQPGGGRPSRAQKALLEKSQLRDKRNQVIPEWLKPVAVAAVRLDSLCTEASDFVKAVEKFRRDSAAGALVETDEITACVTVIRNELQRARFWCCCPDCKAKGAASKECSCKGRGWHSQESFSAAKLNGGR